MSDPIMKFTVPTPKELHPVLAELAKVDHACDFDSDGYIIITGKIESDEHYGLTEVLETRTVEIYVDIPGPVQDIILAIYWDDRYCDIETAKLSKTGKFVTITVTLAFA